MGVSRQDDGRVNQKRRTRTALVQAAAALAREGRQPTVAEAAAAALISKATAYRYFPTQQALLMEAAFETIRPEPAAVLARIPEDDARARLAAVQKALHAVVVADEVLFRTMLRATQERWLDGAGRDPNGRVPVRQGRRMELIDAALADLRTHLPTAAWERLRAGLALTMGIEALIVLEDVCGLGREEALAVMLWAGEALLAASLREAATDSSRWRTTTPEHA